MRDTLVDLYQHQEWADAELWRASEAHAGALSDKTFWERLHHIHLVQQAFLGIAQGLDVRQMKFSKPEDYASPSDLKAEARQYHTKAAAFLKETTADAFARTIRIPWFKEPALEITMGQALLQAAMHSHGHRAQNATRLRELGGSAPTIDYIMWLWKGKAAPIWT